MDKLAAVILAAGEGKRMHSRVPKVLHTIGGRPLISFPIALSYDLGCDPIVIVVGHSRELVEERVREAAGEGNIRFALQKEQRGTGHAAQCALQKLKGLQGRVLILSGDVPLLDKESIVRLKEAFDKAGGPLALLTFCPADTAGYGRVLRENGHVVGIREKRDCTGDEKNISEVNAGIYLIEIDFLRKAIRQLDNHNSQKEFYLTDLIEIAAKNGTVAAVEVDPEKVIGINDRVELAAVEALLRQRINGALMKSGVTINRPESVDIDTSVSIGQDAEIGPQVQLRGKTSIGSNCRIETGTLIRDSVLENDVVIKAYSVIEESRICPHAIVGPFARIRPQSVIGDSAHVGNFVEVKNTTLGARSKANHLTYLGDGVIGEGVNVGAGTIFCNYDGFQKHKTVLEDNVFIGSDSQLIAPLTVGEGAYVASGSTVTRNVPKNALAHSRVRQENKEGLAEVLRNKLKARKEKQEAERPKGKKGGKK